MAITCPTCSSGSIEYLSNYPNGQNCFLTATSLQQCRECSLIFAYPIPHKDDVTAYYLNGSYYDGATPFSSEFMGFSRNLAKSRLNLLLPFLSKGMPQRVLDVGAGNAAFANVLHDFDRTVLYDAVEPDGTVRAKWEGQISAAYADIEEIQNKRYSVVLLFQVLEHLFDPCLFLRKIYNLLEADGLIYIDVPNRDDLYKPSIEPHLLVWEKKSLCKFTETNGFEILYNESVGMKHADAKRFFNASSKLDKLFHLIFVKGLINRILKDRGFTWFFDTFKHFHSNRYGGDRQWLRCIARKISYK